MNIIHVLTFFLIAAVTTGVAAPDTPKRPISDAQFKKILDDMAANGAVRAVPTRLTKALGLTKGDEVLTLRRVGYRDDKKLTHTLMRLENDRGYLFAFSAPSVIYFYNVSKDLNTITAAIKDTIPSGITMLSKDEAQKGLDTELAFFATIADRLD